MKYFDKLTLKGKATVSIALALIILFSIVFLFKKVGDFRNNVAISASDNKAQKAEDKAANHEGQADAAKAQADALEAQKTAAEQQLADVRKQLVASQKSLAERKRQLDEARHNINIDHSGTLDEREQRLLARLETLYPDN